MNGQAIAAACLAAQLAAAGCAQGSRPAAVARDEAGEASATLAFETRGTLAQGARARADVELELDRRRLVVGFGWSGTPRTLRLEVRASGGTGEPRVLLKESVASPGGPEGWLERQVPVPDALVGQRVRLELRAEAPGGSAFLARPVLVEAAGGAEGPPNLILLSVDTLRADRLGCYGNARPTSPNLDRLARAGLRFANAYAPSNWTLPSHYSMLSGLYPAAHGVDPDFHRVAGYRHPSEKLQMRGSGAERMLAERLAELGYLTAAITEDGWMYPRFGFDQGFASYVADTYGSLASTRARALAWLEAHGEARFFLFLHTFQPHMPYDAPEPYAGMFLDPRHAGILLPGVSVPVRFLELFADRTFPPMRAEVEAFRALYDGEVRYVDDFVGALVEVLERRGLAQRTVLIVTGDHGEELFEHGGLGHGETLHEEAMRVPLIVWGPRWIPQGQVVETHVSLVDLVPTLLRLAGGEPEPPLQGEDLLALAAREKRQGEIPRAVFAEAWAPGGARLGAVWLGPRKYVVRRGSEVRESFYDLARDPDERSDLAPRHPGELEALRQLWGRFQEDSAAIRERLGPVETVPAPEVQERLRALGYVD